MFEKHLKDQKKQKQEELKEVAIFPAKMSILPDCIFAKRDPIVIGVKIDDGQLRVGAPICVPNKVCKSFFVFVKTVLSKTCVLAQFHPLKAATSR